MSYSYYEVNLVNIFQFGMCAAKKTESISRALCVDVYIFVLNVKEVSSRKISLSFLKLGGDDQLFTDDVDLSINMRCLRIVVSGLRGQRGANALDVQ